MDGAERLRHRLPPPWLGNLLVFGVLFVLVLVWFFVQTRQAEQVFLRDAGEHARLLADAVGLHARGAVLAQNATDAILVAHLGSAARFVDYLDRIEPFYADELSAFAAESGLSVIRVVRASTRTQGPANWRSDIELSCRSLQRLIRLPAAHSVVFGAPRQDSPGCVLVGMDSRRVEALQAAIGLPAALSSVRALPGVVSVTMHGEPKVDALASDSPSIPGVSMNEAQNGRVVARARSAVAGAQMVLDLDAGPLLQARRQLWLEFSTFALVLLVSGGIGTWLLFRRQQRHDRQVRDFERSLAQQGEEAGLGRAAAAIAHEIRNPLNAVAMGLQRLQFEASELSGEHQRLVDLVLQAVRRTDGAVGGLLEYARSYQPQRQTVLLDALVRDQLAIYQQRIKTADLQLQLSLSPNIRIEADPDLLRQVLDNLLRNALEAQAYGGLLAITLNRVQNDVYLCVLNEGFKLASSELERILEPWYTTKTEGTGLGLPICRRIVLAHGGELSIDLPQAGRLRVSIRLPDKMQPMRAQTE